jgi:hypothetical protein
MTTNNEFTIPVSQTDRRNIFFKCNDTYVGNYEYWTQFNNHISKDEVARAFYEYLLNYNLSSVLKTFEIEVIENDEDYLQDKIKEELYSASVDDCCLSCRSFMQKSEG